MMGDITIGDVGYVRAGVFERAFNQLHERDHEINDQYGVPPGFAPWTLQKQDILERPMAGNTTFHSGFQKVLEDEKSLNW